MIQSGPVLVNGVSRRLQKGEPLPGSVRLEVPGYRRSEDRRPLIDSGFSLRVLAQERGWLAVAKPAGLAVHPLEPEERGTVLNGLLARHPEILGVGEGGLRSGVVHRLDVPTSGALLFAREESAYRRLRRAFREHRIEKRYLAWVAGRPDSSGELCLPLFVAQHRPARVRVAAGRHAQFGRETRLVWRTLEERSSCSLLEVGLETGFLHQIRVSFAHLGHPLLGDPVYGNPPSDRRLMLHAESLRSAELGIDVRCPLPEDWLAGEPS